MLVHVPVEFTEWRQAPEVRDGEVSFIRNDKVLEWRTTNTGKITSRTDTVSTWKTTCQRTQYSDRSGSQGQMYDTVFNEAEIGCRLSDRMEVGVTARED